MKPESNDSNPINSIQIHEISLIPLYVTINIYFFIYSLNIMVGRTPLEMKYHSSFLSIQQQNTALEIIHLKIMIII